jgi:hypothetical protein
MSEKKKLNVKLIALTIVICVLLSVVIGYFVINYLNAIGQTLKLVPAQTQDCTIQGKTYYFTYIHYSNSEYESGDDYFAVTSPQQPDIHLEDKQTATGKTLLGAYIAEVGKSMK